jgi:hypothetical protein
VGRSCSTHGEMRSAYKVVFSKSEKGDHSGDNEALGFINMLQFLAKVSNCQLLKKDSVL